MKWQEHPYTPRQVCLVITVQDGSYIEKGRLGFAYTAQRETAACTDSHRTLSLSLFLALLVSSAPFFPLFGSFIIDCAAPLSYLNSHLLPPLFFCLPPR